MHFIVCCISSDSCRSGNENFFSIDTIKLFVGKVAVRCVWICFDSPTCVCFLHSGHGKESVESDVLLIQSCRQVLQNVSEHGSVIVSVYTFAQREHRSCLVLKVAMVAEIDICQQTH